MQINEILSKDRIVFGIKANEKSEIIREMASLFLKDGIVEEAEFETLIFDLMERENLTSTGMQDGIAIPHAKSPAVKKLSLAVAIDKEGKDFASLDEEKSTMFFMIVAPITSKREHLDILALISKLSLEEELLEKLLNTTDKDEVVNILESL